MKKLILGILIVASAVSAKSHQWHDAVVVGAQTGAAGSIATSSVTGTEYGATGFAVAAPIIVTYYSIKSEGVTYVVGCVPRGTLRYKCPDITINGKTKIWIDGRNAHVLDDDGKDRKVPIIQKIADLKP